MEIAAKRLELLKEVVPRLKRVSVIFNAANPFSAIFLSKMKAAAERTQVELHQFGVSRLEEFPGVFTAMTQKRVEAVVIGEDPLLNSHGGAIAALAATHRLPAIGFPNFPDAGGLLGYGANRPLVYGRVASFVDRILKGAKPGDLPIEGATKFDLIVNLRTAKALGVKIPPQLLLRADKVIE